MLRVPAAALLLNLCLAAPPAAAALVLQIGDTVYVDGKEYTVEEWAKVRDSRAAQPQSSPSDSAARAASCITAAAYDQFPADEERFDCTAGLGSQTRDELIRAGWKIDFVDKIPAAGSASRYRYKLVISR
jgi:hypothetical protein